MAGNPLVNSAPQATTIPAKKPERLVSLISNAPPNQITGLDDFLSVFNTGDVGAEIQPFRFVISRKSRRGMGGKFGKGLTTEVVENVVINPNEDLFGMRRWLGAVRTNPASVLLLNVNKIRDEALAAPLIFSILFKTGRPILVTGVDESMQDQLFAEPDLTFKTIPISIQRNPELAEQLLARVQRRKGFINTIRNLLEFDFIPPEMRDKINKINAGADPTELSREEIVNIALVADLAARYQHVLEQFKGGYVSGSTQMNQLASMFELLLADLPMTQAIEAFKPHLGDDGMAAMMARTITSKPTLLSHIHKHLSTREGSTRGAKLEPKAEFARALANVVIRHRLRVDPFLWKRCAFLGNRAPSEHAVAKSLQPLHGALSQALTANPDQVPSEIKAILGRETFDLLRMAMVPQEQIKSESDARRKRAAARLLSQLEISGFNPAEVMQAPAKYTEQLAGAEAFAEFYVKRDILVRDLRHIVTNLEVAMTYVEAIAEQVRKSTLDVIHSHAKDRERVLRKIYIVKALPELLNFSFFLGDKGLASIERLCGMSILRSRFGLDVHAKPTEFDSIGLFADPNETPLGRLDNEPELLSHAYTEMMSLQVETHTRRIIDKKINYFQSTFGENFFEVIYNNVVTEHDLPVSSSQFASVVRERGVLGSLDSRGWKNQQDDQIVDPFMTFTKLEARKGEEGAPNQTFATFEETFRQTSATFRQMLNELKAFSEGNPDPADIKPAIWGLFKRGSYNLASAEAHEDFRKCPTYKTLKELIAKISSENYSVFAKETEKGVKIFVPRKYQALTLIGNRFAFLVENKVVRYQLLVTPVSQPDQMDPISRAFLENIEALFNSSSIPADYKALVQATEDIRRAEQQWRSYSQYLAFAILDRLLGETVIKDLVPGKVRTENLFYIPDSKKLCLGPAMSAGQTLPFSKILQNPENTGNIQKNPRSSSTTIDDFAIEVHKIGRVREELSDVRGISEDVLEILQNLTHSKGESSSVIKYEHNLQLLIRVLSKPIRQVREEDIQALHTVARDIRDILRGMYAGVQSNTVATLLQNELQSRRSDGHNLKLNFTDSLIIEKSEVTMMQKVTAGDGAVSRKQKKVEVELDSAHQTLALRIREIINTQKLLQSKQHIVFSPEGQKKKQVDYILDIIETLLALRGKAVMFYIDNTMLSDTQEQQLATRIKPHNFFEMGLLKPRQAEGMNLATETDPLSGRTRVVKGGGNSQTPAPPGDAPAPSPAAVSKETIFRGPREQGFEYRLDHETSKYSFNDGGNWIPSRALPVDLGAGATSTILMTKLGTGKLQFHGLIGKELLLPQSARAQPPTVCAFSFLDCTVRVVNEGGKAVVRVDKREDSFVDELRSL